MTDPRKSMKIWYSTAQFINESFRGVASRSNQGLLGSEFRQLQEFRAIYLEGEYPSLKKLNLFNPGRIL